MDKDKERQEISLLGRFLTMEALLVLMGALSLVSGILAVDWIRIASGFAIIVALLVYLMKRRRRSVTSSDLETKNRNPDA